MVEFHRRGRLDPRRAQVYIAGLVAEVNNNKVAQFGIQWQLPLNSTNNQTVGVLGVNNKTKHDIFTERHRDLLTNLATYAAIAIENARIHGQSIRRQHELKALIARIRDTGIVAINRVRRVSKTVLYRERDSTLLVMFQLAHAEEHVAVLESLVQVTARIDVGLRDVKARVTAGPAAPVGVFKFNGLCGRVQGRHIPTAVEQLVFQ